MTPLNYMEASAPGFLEEQRSNLESQLNTTAREIDGYRQALNPVPSDRAWVKQWPGLGSAKTWAKILDSDFDEMRVETQLPNYRGVASALAARKREQAEEVLYADMAGSQALSLATLQLMHHYGKDRLILAKGGNGTGKTSALTVVSREVAAGSMYMVEANDTWKSDKEAYQDILKTLGIGEDSIAKLTTNGQRLQALLSILNRKGRIILAFDEAHHFTGRTLNIIKTLMNRTEVLIILAGMDTLISKLKAAASEEAKQVFQNRLFQCVHLCGPDAAGVGEFFRRRLKVEGAWSANTLKSIATNAVHCGAWSFVRRILDHLGNTGNFDPDDSDLMAAANSAMRELA